MFTLNLLSGSGRTACVYEELLIIQNKYARLLFAVESWDISLRFMLPVGICASYANHFDIAILLHVILGDINYD